MSVENRQKNFINEIMTKQFLVQAINYIILYYIISYHKMFRSVLFKK